MQPSQLNTLVIPIVGSPNAATLMKAAEIPLRIVVRNIGPGAALLSHDPGTLQNVPVLANTYNLPVGGDDTFVLVPKQGLYAVGIGVGCVLCVAVSEAIPIKDRHGAETLT